MSLPDSDKSSIQTNAPTKSGYRKSAMVGGAVLLLLALYVFVSPYIAVRRMRNAIVSKDADTVSSYIDFLTFKENFKTKLKTKLIAEVNKNIQKDKDNPFAGQGMLHIEKAVSTLADSFISPEGIKRALNGDNNLPQNDPTTQAPDLLNPKLFDGSSVNTSTGYNSYGSFSVKLTSKTDPSKTIEYIFERHNLINWELVDMKFQ